MSKPRSVDEIALWNGIITPIKLAQQKITVTGTAALSEAFKTQVATIYASQDCWLTFGSSPTAAVNDGNSCFHPAGFIKAYRTEIGEKLSVIRDTTNGVLHIQGGA